jgi:hypothetical protein
VWEFDRQIRVTQHVEIVYGEQSGKLDTCLVWYRLENNGTVERKVGVRMMLDTYIGANDGVPFVIPGQQGLLTDMRDFKEKEIPDYIEALEKPDLAEPGTVAHIGLKGIPVAIRKKDAKGKDGDPELVQLEPIERMLICHWSGSEIRWELEPERIRSIEGDKNQNEPDDSCVFLYWPYREMAPREVRYMAFTYGLGKMSASPIESSNKTQVGLTTGGAFRPGGEFTVTGYVKGAKEGQKIKIDLPPQLKLVAGQEEEKTVEAPDKKAGYSQVSWRVKAVETGEYEVKVTSAGVTAKDKVKIAVGRVFGSE